MERLFGRGVEVFAVRGDGERKLVAGGQQALIRVNKP